MAENEKYTYEITSGSPMSGKPCTVAEMDGTEIRAHYKGYYNPKARTWKLYPHRIYTYGRFDKKTLPERAVKMGK